ncbi:hypothetical protein [Paraburkholderia caledonica]|uniref:Uncharacterized protein n=1 Tax=Paraburkholderia caledonica TaxID=134536 RepID=A0AB73IAI4_9BURK|nr:hypothetical protein [Paraburkholderia caledonica]
MGVCTGTITSIYLTREGEPGLLASRTVAYTDAAGAPRTVRLEAIGSRDADAIAAVVAFGLPADIAAVKAGDPAGALRAWIERPNGAVQV